MQNKVISTVCLLLICVHSYASELVNKVAIVVNTSPILESAYIEQLDENNRLMEREFANGTLKKLLSPEEVKKQTIEQLIQKKVQLLEAQRVGVRIQSQAIDKYLENIAVEENLSIIELTNKLIQDFGSVEAYRQKIHDSLTIAELQKSIIRDRIAITDSEVRDFLATESGRNSAQLDYSFIYARIDAAIANKNTVLADLEKILHDKSIQPNQVQDTKIDGVILKYFELRPIAKLPTLVQEIVPRLQTGQVSQVIKDERGWHLVKVTAIKGSKPILQKRVHTRHILLTPNLIRNKEQTMLQMQEIWQKIQDGADFAEQAAIYSEDVNSQKLGGDLGFMAYESLVPRYVQAINALEIGEVSKPFQTTFGIHIAQKLAVKEQDISVMNEMGKIRQYLYNQKVTDELPRWINELKNRAFIDIRI